MQRSSIALLAAGILVSAGAGVAADREGSEAKLAKALAGYTPGKPMSCIGPSSATMSSRTYGKTIVYSNGVGQLYRNDTTGGCEGAERNDVLVSVEHQGRPCSGDIVHTVDQSSHMMTGSCALGQFVPYTKVR